MLADKVSAFENLGFAHAPLEFIPGSDNIGLTYVEVNCLR